MSRFRWRRGNRSDSVPTTGPESRSAALSDYLAGPRSSPRDRGVTGAGKHLRCPNCSQMTPAADWPAWGDRTPFFNQTRRRTEDEPGICRIEINCLQCGDDFFVVWDRDPRPSAERIPTAPPVALPPNDALRALQTRVGQLGVAHPLGSSSDLDPKLDLQIPWIARTLEEAAMALETGFDPFDKPITDTQIVNGLRTLTSMVREPSYLAIMETGHPGIGPGLRACMIDLETIVRGLLGTPAVDAPGTPGIDILVRLVMEPGILSPQRLVAQAVGAPAHSPPSSASSPSVGVPRSPMPSRRPEGRCRSPSSSMRSEA